ncbi:hypothetical protein [Synechococcus sp. PCC 6312]|uniref:hypothetical protein n=1 Tax=Synechococcus sp. (strain ATCC 27167 / PCC 6312) TaxID=195253 RepID=UPI00029F39C2|nr:hypothetical protein [Synechococcus sp. PCC 6312]AFY61922.1 hypothetical protein Syn6312_2857 [Synechococcus sp. PCC 6312]
MTTIYFNPTPVIPIDNPFHKMVGVPDGYLLACTSDACFCNSIFQDVVARFRAIADNPNVDVTIIRSILFVSPSVAAKVYANPKLALLR